MPDPELIRVIDLRHSLSSGRLTPISQMRGILPLIQQLPVLRNTRIVKRRTVSAAIE
jgi:hypothetical protein